MSKCESSGKEAKIRYANSPEDCLGEVLEKYREWLLEYPMHLTVQRFNVKEAVYQIKRWAEIYGNRGKNFWKPTLEGAMMALFRLKDEEASEEDG